mmetsp:Transcript_74760/g.109642  ORF Transcript_74760/g.109642 Transcript_74760/m.109642 type:complete len:221 (-) Transcript_74760:178-840(-)|eukprot:CAMPEP_0179405328 /NCGR_PEP_ID=MMETSP0799-20121207/214_1 /TAXON_ID=46947 /ORGANISM="Geminigera cryophila, Strain CCMP2564" /LENGTH=220 /DNA_ID=CAMNT_0021176141 /DNA_START=35 /DNA_END=697 /DNA_ORIENTATION=-
MNSLSRQMMQAAVLVLFLTPAHAATTCQTYKHSYAEETSCGSLKGQSAFTVSRCAASQDELQEYMTGQGLGKNLDPDGCKILWLEGCRTFPLPDVVVVPKSIKCNNVVCDQSPFYSNCVTDEDCAGISRIEDGLGGGSLASTGYVWPTAGNHSEILQRYRPCCEFYVNHCNGAAGPSTQMLGEDKSYSPAKRAQNGGLCESSSDQTPKGLPVCWTVKLQK